LSGINNLGEKPKKKNKKRFGYGRSKYTSAMEDRETICLAILCRKVRGLKDRIQMAHRICVRLDFINPDLSKEERELLNRHRVTKKQEEIALRLDHYGDSGDCGTFNSGGCLVLAVALFRYIRCYMDALRVCFVAHMAEYKDVGLQCGHISVCVNGYYLDSTGWTLPRSERRDKLIFSEEELHDFISEQPYHISYEEDTVQLIFDLLCHNRA